jgi:hypothetical protein
MVTPTGGTVDRLSFVVFGDVRPADEDADDQYPVSVLNSITGKAAASPAQFVVSTGDYMYSSTEASAQSQLSKLLQAESVFGARPTFHVMGNHECMGSASSNCPNGTESPNVRAFQMMLVPFAQRPYYTFSVQTSMGEAKFIIIAANAWDDTQGLWLEQQLARATPYTIVVRHEPPGQTDAPGRAASDDIIARHPLTLGIYGHKHEYRRLSANAVISGNSGAPLACGAYGFLYVVQRPDGNVQVEEHRQDNGNVVDAWAVTPTGTPAP